MRVKQQVEQGETNQTHVQILLTYQLICKYKS